MCPPYISVHVPISLRSLKSHRSPRASQIMESGGSGRECEGSRRLKRVVRTLLLVIGAMGLTRANAQSAPPASDRITINLSQGVPNFVGNAAATDPNAALPQSNWWYENNQDSNPTSSTFAAPRYAEVDTPVADSGPACGSTLSTPNWTQVGIPTDANIWRSFINQSSGG